MPVVDVAARFNMSRYRVYQLSRSRSRRPPVFQRLYISHARFEITLASISAYEAHIISLNDKHARTCKPSTPLDFTRGVKA